MRAQARRGVRRRFGYPQVAVDHKAQRAAGLVGAAQGQQVLLAGRQAGVAEARADAAAAFALQVADVHGKILRADAARRTQGGAGQVDVQRGFGAGVGDGERDDDFLAGVQHRGAARDELGFASHDGLRDW
ncbi:hypothetical protein ACXZ1M_05815 [Duganella sp. PWIR1]